MKNTEIFSEVVMKMMEAISINNKGECIITNDSIMEEADELLGQLISEHARDWWMESESAEDSLANMEDEIDVHKKKADGSHLNTSKMKKDKTVESLLHGYGDVDRIFEDDEEFGPVDGDEEFDDLRRDSADDDMDHDEDDMDHLGGDDMDHMDADDDMDMDMDHDDDMDDMDDADFDFSFLDDEDGDDDDFGDDDFNDDDDYMTDDDMSDDMDSDDEDFGDEDE